MQRCDMLGQVWDACPESAFITSGKGECIREYKT